MAKELSLTDRACVLAVVTLLGHLLGDAEIGVLLAMCVLTIAAARSSVPATRPSR